MSSAGKKTATRKKTLSESEVAGVFGIELAEPQAAEAGPTSTGQVAKPARGKAGKPKAVEKATQPVPKAAGKAPRAPRARKGKKDE